VSPLFLESALIPFAKTLTREFFGISFTRVMTLMA